MALILLYLAALASAERAHEPGYLRAKDVVVVEIRVEIKASARAIFVRFDRDNSTPRHRRDRAMRLV